MIVGVLIACGVVRVFALDSSEWKLSGSGVLTVFGWQQLRFPSVTGVHFTLWRRVQSACAIVGPCAVVPEKLVHELMSGATVVCISRVQHHPYGVQLSCAPPPTLTTRVFKIKWPWAVLVSDLCGRSVAAFFFP